MASASGAFQAAGRKIASASRSSRTRDFFESVGVKTRLKDYGLTPEIVDTVCSRLAARGWTGLGEHHDVGPREVEEILAYSL